MWACYLQRSTGFLISKIKENSNIVTIVAVLCLHNILQTNCNSSILRIHCQNPLAARLRRERVFHISNEKALALCKSTFY